LILKEAKVLSGPVEKKKQKIKDKAELWIFCSSSECKGYRNVRLVDFVMARKVGRWKGGGLLHFHCQYQNE
jgi:hypothetical protein